MYLNPNTLHIYMDIYFCVHYIFLHLYIYAYNEYNNLQPWPVIGPNADDDDDENDDDDDDKAFFPNATRTERVESPMKQPYLNTYPQPRPWEVLLSVLVHHYPQPRPNVSAIVAPMGSTIPRDCGSKVRLSYNSRNDSPFQVVHCLSQLPFFPYQVCRCPIPPCALCGCLAVQYEWLDDKPPSADP